MARTAVPGLSAFLRALLGLAWLAAEAQACEPFCDDCGDDKTCGEWCRSRGECECARLNPNAALCLYLAGHCWRLADADDPRCARCQNTHPHTMSDVVTG